MDVDKALRELYQERYRLDRAIAKLEIKQRTGVYEVLPPSRTGRKTMSPEERQLVSQRMIYYWAQRKIATA